VFFCITKALTNLLVAEPRNRHEHHAIILRLPLLWLPSSKPCLLLCLLFHFQHDVPLILPTHRLRTMGSYFIQSINASYLIGLSEGSTFCGELACCSCCIFLLAAPAARAALDARVGTPASFFAVGASVISNLSFV